MAFSSIEKRRAYDRAHQKRLYAKFKEDRQRVIDLLGGCCVKCKTTKNLQLHHIFYGPESNYPRNCKSQNTRRKRVAEALQFPERFELRCAKCHHIGDNTPKAHIEYFI